MFGPDSVYVTVAEKVVKPRWFVDNCRKVVWIPPQCRITVSYNCLDSVVFPFWITTNPIPKHWFLKPVPVLPPLIHHFHLQLPQPWFPTTTLNTPVVLGWFTSHKGEADNIAPDNAGYSPGVFGNCLSELSVSFTFLAAAYFESIIFIYYTGGGKSSTIRLDIFSLNQILKSIVLS